MTASVLQSSYFGGNPLFTANSLSHLSNSIETFWWTANTCVCVHLKLGLCKLVVQSLAVVHWQSHRFCHECFHLHYHTLQYSSSAALHFGHLHFLAKVPQGKPCSILSMLNFHADHKFSPFWLVNYNLVESSIRPTSLWGIPFHSGRKGNESGELEGLHIEIQVLLYCHEIWFLGFLICRPPKHPLHKEENRWSVLGGPDGFYCPGAH